MTIKFICLNPRCPEWKALWTFLPLLDCSLDIFSPNDGSGVDNDMTNVAEPFTNVLELVAKSNRDPI